jgi:hypothetical protein
VIFLKSNPFQFKETVILFNKKCDIGKVMQSGTVQQEMLTEATETKETFISHFCDIKS